MPIDTTPLTLLTLAETFEEVIERLNDTIEVVNGLPASVSGSITRLGGTIDGATTGALLIGSTGTLFVLNGGGVGIGDFLDEDEETTVTGLLNVLKNTGYANVYIEAGATRGETGGTSNAAVLMLRDIGLANNYTKISALPDVAGVPGAGSGRESLVPVMVHTHMADSGADLEYQELMRIERQSTAALGSGRDQASYINFRHVDEFDTQWELDSVYIVARQSEGAETDGVFEVWCASSGTPGVEFVVNKTKTHIPRPVESTSSTTGSLQVDGGMGIAKDVFVGSNVHVEGTADAADSAGDAAGSVRTSGGVAIAKQLFTGANTNVGTNIIITSNLVVSGTADSAHSADGALEIAGGAGVGKRVHVGARTTADALQVTGTTPLMGVVHSPRGWIGGMVISMDGDGDDMDLNITAGECRDFANGNTCVLDTEITKQLDASWAPGDDAGGFPTAGITLTNTTWYRVFIIRSVLGEVDAGFDTSATATNLIAEMVLSDPKWTGATYRQIQWVVKGVTGMRRFWVTPSAPEHVMWEIPVMTHLGVWADASRQEVLCIAPPYSIALQYTEIWVVERDSEEYPIQVGPTGTTGKDTEALRESVDNQSSHFNIWSEGDNSGDHWQTWHHPVEVGDIISTWYTASEIHWMNSTGNGSIKWGAGTMGFQYGRQRNE